MSISRRTARSYSARRVSSVARGLSTNGLARLIGRGVQPIGSRSGAQKPPVVTREAEEDWRNQDLRPESANYRDLEGGARLRFDHRYTHQLITVSVCAYYPARWSNSGG